MNGSTPGGSLRIAPAVVLSTLLLAACSGGGSGSGGSLPATPSVQQVTGTLSIGYVTNTSSAARKPAYVSAATTHAYVFINGSATPNNTSTSACTSGGGTTGTGTFCTISWSAALPVPGSYTFDVETDNGSKVLAEGAATYAIVAGNNTLGTLTLNGVVAQVSFATTSCTAGMANSVAGTCSGTVTLEDAAGNSIAYTGAATVPTAGNSPTTGTVFDNGNVTFVSSLPTAGVVTGTAQTSGANVFSSFASNTLTVSGVNTTGVYTFAVACASASANGTFGITVGGGTSPSGDVTATELGNETPVATYPASVTTVATAPSYTCSSGVISSATGTLPIN